VNIRDELEKQIDFLQKSLLNATDLRTKREYIQNNEIYRRTEQNSLLIDELNKNKKNFTDLEKDFKKLKSDYSALEKKLENYQRMERENMFSSKHSVVIDLY
jgi:predicted  nucleic acid-binding Zn-ribbon protein